MSDPQPGAERRWVASVRLEIPFHDVDAMKVVWHGHYFKYFDLARTELFRSINYDVPDMVESGFAWPVIECHCRYPRPLRYGMQIDVTATLLEYENRVKIAYRITDADTGERLSRGHTVQVALDMARRKMCVETPNVFLERLGL